MNELLGSPPLPSPLIPSTSVFCPHPPILYPFPLKVGPKIELEGLGSAVSSHDGVWGRAPAEIEFGAFYPYNLTSDCNKFKDFRENHMIKFHAEFGNTKMLQNIELRLPVKQ